jgi:CheY-like chemotaxis protein
VPHTLLLADDSVTIQRVIELTFAEEDVDVVAVSDGDQAIKHLESAPPDIVLADIGMPGRDGYEVARYIRQTPKLAHIPVVLLTGAFEPVDQAKAAEVGCDGVLAKPFEPQLVIGRVKELLAGIPRGGARPFDGPFAATAGSSGQSEPSTSAANLDEYFDRLDSAFANRGGHGAATAPSAEQASAPVVTQPPVRTESVGDQSESFAAPHDGQPSSDPELPLSYASLAPPPVEPAAGANAAAPFAAPSAAGEPPAAPAPQPPPAPAPAASSFDPGPAQRSGGRELPSVSDAFAAILAAEQADAGPSARPAWPMPVAAAPPPAPPAAPELSSEAIDQIVQRVLASIAVGDRVTEIAERLIREEIDRIKASMK